MSFTGNIFEKLAFKHLKMRALQFGDLWRNPIPTIYPRRMEEGKTSPKRVLVLTPHADDETFGAGGTIRWHLERGDEVHVVLFTDNTESIQAPEAEKEDIRTLRQKEFLSALETLGNPQRTMLQMEEKEFSQNTVKNPRMEALLVENQPDVLYLPSLFDNHQDHRTLNIWAGTALKHTPTDGLTCRGYEVWSPLPATAVLDITSLFEIKQQAIRCYRSQLQNIRYDHHIAGLNAYRAMTCGNGAMYAEAFLEMPADEYATLIEMYLES